jgi:hypothetical protein
MSARVPSIKQDGWCLGDGEERHAEAPDTFWIPPLDAREGLYPGCLAKLIFHIHAPDAEDVERMWVVVTKRLTGAGYLGVLDNTPCSEWAPGRLEVGFELPFEPHHVIDIWDPNDYTMAIVEAEPARRWS